MDKILAEKLSQIGDGVLCPIALIFKEGKILIGLRHYTRDKYKQISVWTMPGGRSEIGETVGTTLKREVEEEVGITDLKIEQFLGEFPGAKEGDIVYVFKAFTKQEFTLREPKKFSEWRWTYPAEIPHNFINLNVLKFIQIYSKNFLEFHDL